MPQETLIVLQIGHMFESTVTYMGAQFKPALTAAAECGGAHGYIEQQGSWSSEWWLAPKLVLIRHRGATR